MPQTISEAMVNGTLASITEPSGEPLPWYADMMESIPTITASSGVKAMRGSGTILKGGSGIGAQHIGSNKWIREGLSQANYANPRNWSRFGSQDYFHHTGKLNIPATGTAARSTQYNPFYMAAGINAVGRAFGGETDNWLGRRLSESKRGQKWQKAGYVGEGRELVSKGFYSRVSAAGRIGMMSDMQFGRTAGNTFNFLKGAGYSADAAQSILQSGTTGTRQALLASGAGTLSGSVGGFAAGTLGNIGKDTMEGMSPKAIAGAKRAAIWGKDIGVVVDPKTGRITARAAAAATGRQIGGGIAGTVGKKAAALGASRGLALMGGSLLTGPAAPVVAAVGALWFAYDMAKLTAKGMGYAARIGVDAHKSFMGGMRTGIMDQGFTDTEATMTSRARGVQAIQNSRLNARGVLGVEAGAMAAHFG